MEVWQCWFQAMEQALPCYGKINCEFPGRFRTYCSSLIDHIVMQNGLFSRQFTLMLMITKQYNDCYECPSLTFCDALKLVLKLNIEGLRYSKAHLRALEKQLSWEFYESRRTITLNDSTKTLGQVSHCYDRSTRGGAVDVAMVTWVVSHGFIE